MEPNYNGVIEMIETFLPINQLSEDARKNAVRGFINFYLNYFKIGNLDVIASQDHDEVVTSINEFILTNRSFQHDELVQRLLDSRYPEFYILLTEINQGYSADGLNLKQPWIQWLDHQEAQIDTKEALS